MLATCYSRQAEMQACMHATVVAEIMGVCVCVPVLLLCVVCAVLCWCCCTASPSSMAPFVHCPHSAALRATPAPLVPLVPGTGARHMFFLTREKKNIRPFSFPKNPVAGGHVSQSERVLLAMLLGGILVCNCC